MSSQFASAARIDHVLVGTSDLESGIAELQRLTGVRAIIGGVHPGRGTRNALISLGDGTYLELLAPDPDQTVDDPDVRQLRNLSGITPIGWAVSGKDEASLRSILTSAALELTPSEPGSRRRADGSILRWNTFSYATIDHPLAPFFILWADFRLHPSRTSPRGCSLTAIRIEDLQPDQLRKAIEPLNLPVQIGQASGRQMTLTMTCNASEITIR